MDAFEDRHEAIEELERDGHSVLLRAVDRDEGVPVLVRRVVRSRRFDVDVRAGLVAEAEYCARLACSRCPEAEVFTLEDGELLLEYKGADGVELDRVFSMLQASGRVLTPAAAVALVSEVLHNAEAIARIKPPAVEIEAWGHGEISPRSVMLGRDGFGRLFEVRLATTGFRSLLAPGSALCRAPELAGGVLFGTPASDVYAVGALMALALFGSSVLAAASAEPLGRVVARAAESAPDSVPTALLEVLRLALDPMPSARYTGPESLREALRTAMPLDLAGWRATAEGLAALARTLSADRRLMQVPEALFAAHPGLARMSGVQGGDIDADVAAFAQDQALTVSQAMAAMSPLADPRVTPQRGTALPRRIAVVPRRVSRAVADAFDIPRTPSDARMSAAPTGDIPRPAISDLRMSPVPSEPRATLPDLRMSPVPSEPRATIPDLRMSPGPSDPRATIADLRMSPIPSDPRLSPRDPTAPAPWMSPAPLHEVGADAPPTETSETVMVDEHEAARELERASRDPGPIHTLEIIPSDPAPRRLQLEILPSDPAPAYAPSPPSPHLAEESEGGMRMMWLVVLGVMLLLGTLVGLTVWSQR